MRRLVNLRGMTLIELLATISIIGILATFSLPPIRGLQARNTLATSQRDVQLMLYRMQQLTLATPQTSSEDETVIGYGLAFHKHDVSGVTQVGNCQVTTDYDFIALYKFVAKSTTGTIYSVLNPFSPDSPCGSASTVVAKSFPTDFYLFPRGTAINQTQSRTQSSPQRDLPWFTSQPLASAGTTYGALTQYVPVSNPIYQNILTTAGSRSKLAIESSAIRTGSNKLCYGVEFWRESNGINLSSKAVTGCQ